ncbi:uncharacterized protein LOC133195610 [Saccostrea echinata]|uniref:uncharacterized protein LOC133173177 n=1 Tax=Saccostrea echinata TaxID=191078 RepID=UPI002A839BD1|nr:uncharacterized protein LOC133173177 [Saccostrea echinata]XP_061180071.1 uncharacterized protein LOC133188599 [Saccostrea echinata]XP_061187481.1 uncharacterized protein LOC133195610 [Saccostrea echinata]
MDDNIFSEHSIIESQEYESSLGHGIRTDCLTGSLQELSEFEESDEISTHTNRDVFSFCDDTPPPVQAFYIREEDLYEQSSEISKELSLISSDLQTSGCSTDSEPFGNLHFIEPLMSSTPKKHIKVALSSRSRLQEKKISKSTIKKASLDQCSCPKKCTRQSFFTKELIENCHSTLWRLNTTDRPKWFQRKFDDFQCVKKGTFKFILKGHRVCLKSWLIAYGIKQSIYYKERRTWLRKEVPPSNERRLTSEKRLHVINWFGEYIAMRGENPPHIQEIWLPFGLRKNEIYAGYKVDTEEENRACVSLQTFLNIWNEHFPHVKIKQSNLFTRCTTCDKLDRELHKQLNPEKKKEIFIKKQEHLHRQMKEKSAYYRRKTVSRRRPDRYISLIIDGMDQSKTNIPHFKGRPSKEFAATRQLNVHVTGVLSHGLNRKYLFTDLHQYKHDSNLTLNVLMKVLWNHSKGKSLPPVLYLQADNCFRENKNKFVLSFLELLVRRRIFYEVQLSFLHVGHTHEDIDQMFSVIADNLRHRDAATLPEMSDILYNAEELRGCLDISGWLSPCLKGVKYHTRTNTFRYRLNELTGDVHICYRKNVDHSWKSLQGSFFKQRENGTLTLPTNVPNILTASLEKVDVANIKKSLTIWTKMMTTAESTWWEKFVTFLQETKTNASRYSRKGAIWYLPKIPEYNPHSIQDSDNSREHPAVPEDLQRMLTNEDENPEVLLCE